MDIPSLLTKTIKDALGGPAFDAGLLGSLTLSEAHALYRLAKEQDSAHFIGRVWKTPPDDPMVEAVRRKCASAYTVALMRFAEMTLELRRMSEVFEKEKIPFLPLKGAVIRDLYPEPVMRTSCDIDVLVHECDLERACEALVSSLGYNLGAKKQHDINLYSEGSVHIELHFTLVGAEAPGASELPLLRVWDFARPEKPGSYRYVLSDDMLFFYHIAHMAKHFVLGGCGIRPLADLYLLARSPSADPVGRAALLREGGLERFAERMEELSEVWFGDGEHTGITQRTERFIFTGSAYGTDGNRIAVGRARKGGRVKYALSRIWLPYRELLNRYPSLARHRLFLPVYQVRRWFRFIFRGRHGSSRKELARRREGDGTGGDDIKSLISELGLD